MRGARLVYGIVRAEAEKKETRCQRRWVTFIQARRGDSESNDQAERERDQGGFMFKGRFVEAIRETLFMRDILDNL